MTIANASQTAGNESPLALTQDAWTELEAMGFDSNSAALTKPMKGLRQVEGRPLIPRKAISAPEILNEAHEYQPRPSSFSRGLRVELPGATMLFLSGTASVDEQGRSIYVGDFQAQCLRTFRNLTALLAAEGASWHDIVRTTCYIRDIERDYDTFNDVRTLFMNALGLDPLPASTGIQARICRSDLLVEIEAMAIIPHENAG